MNDIDRRIKEALKEENAEMFEEFNDVRPTHEMLTDFFNIRPRWLLVATGILTLVLLTIGFYAGKQFYYAQEIREMLFWGGLFFGCFLGITTIKIWGWMEMTKNSVTREIKRLELQIIYLSGKLNKK